MMRGESFTLNVRSVNNNVIRECDRIHLRFNANILIALKLNLIISTNRPIRTEDVGRQTRRSNKIGLKAVAPLNYDRNVLDEELAICSSPKAEKNPSIGQMKT